GPSGGPPPPAAPPGRRRVCRAPDGAGKGDRGELGALAAARAVPLVGFNRLEVGVGWPVENLPQFFEARSVARTVPVFLVVVPADDAAEVRADRAELVDLACFVPVDRELVQATPHDSPGVHLDLLDGSDLSR